VPDPQDVQSEEALIGSILVSPAVAKKVEVKPEEFYRPRHGLIWDAAVKCAGNGGCDPVTVAAELERRGQLEEIGGRDRLLSLAATTPAPRNASAYAKRVKEKAEMRAIRRSAQAVLEAVDNEDEPAIAQALEALGHPVRLVDTRTGEALTDCPGCADQKKIVAEKERRIKGLELALANNRVDREQKARDDPLYDEALGIFDWWRIACNHPDVTFTHEEFELIAPHLRRSKKEGRYHCLEAIAGAAFNPFETEMKNGRIDRKNDWGLVFRNREKLRSFRQRAPENWRRWLLDWIEAQFK
jgi:hypothetical protein